MDNPLSPLAININNDMDEGVEKNQEVNILQGQEILSGGGRTATRTFLQGKMIMT